MGALPKSFIGGTTGAPREHSGTAQTALVLAANLAKHPFY